MSKARITTTTILAAILLAALPYIGAQPPGPAPAPAPGPVTMAPSPSLDCFDHLLNLSDCLTFVDSESNLTRPDPGCCPELAGLVQSQPVCLCELLSNSSDVGFSVDTKRALMLPSLCSISTPPLRLCAAVGFPIGVPLPSPSPGESPTDSPSDNGGPSNLGPNQHSLIGLILVLFTSFFI